MQDIIKGYPIPKVGHYKVCARSITYNQSAYIEDCLNGVAMQQTNFPFVHHVIDDCSTDGEQNVIKDGGIKVVDDEGKVIDTITRYRKIISDMSDIMGK